MEHKPNNAAIVAKKLTQKGDEHDGWPLPKKKRHGAMHFFRAALYVITLKSGKSKSAHFRLASRWQKLVSAIRPLQIHDHQSPPRPIENTPVEVTAPAVPVPVPCTEVVEPFDVFTPPLSPHYDQASTSSQSSGLNSNFASAQNLQEFFQGADQDSDEEEDEGDSYYDDKVGDEMIDVKAEQFIAQFYEQMRLQKKSTGAPYH